MFQSKTTVPIALDYSSFSFTEESSQPSVRAANKLQNTLMVYIMNAAEQLNC